MRMNFFRKTDILIVGLILLVSLTIYVAYHLMVDGQTTKAEIYYKSQLVKSVDLGLKNDQTFSIPEKPNVVFHVYADGRICFEQSDCPDQVCVHTGKLEMAGEYAACLPNDLILKIVPAKEGQEADADLVVGN